jgi:hypothetical protein
MSHLRLRTYQRSAVVQFESLDPFWRRHPDPGAVQRGEGLAWELIRHALPVCAPDLPSA